MTEVFGPLFVRFGGCQRKVQRQPVGGTHAMPSIQTNTAKQMDRHQQGLREIRSNLGLHALYTYCTNQKMEFQVAVRGQAFHEQ